MGRFDADAWARQHIVQESAAPPVEQLRIREVGTSQLGTAPAGGKTRREITIIKAGWGSSGYYSREVLARDGPKVFPKGTHMYMNHPSTTEDIEQPERRVEHLAAVLASDPYMEGNELKATADIYEHWAPVINATANDIGVSIRAIGEGEPGEAEGRKGNIVTRLVEGISVDFVTKAGAGGKVGMLMESAEQVGAQLEEARNAADWFASRIHARFTMVADDMFGEGHLTRDERIGLSAAIGAALDAFNAHVDEELPQLKQRDPYADPEQEGVVEEAAAAAETNKEEPSMGDDEKRQLSEATERLRQLEERLTTLETERDEERQARERAEDALMQERARRVVEEALAADPAEGEDALPELPERAHARVVETALKGKLPVDENGKLDKDRLAERARKAVREEAEYLSGGDTRTGQVSGFGVSESAGAKGGNGEGDNQQLSEKSKKELVSYFQRSGMSEKAAIAAAEGR